MLSTNTSGRSSPPCSMCWSSSQLCGRKQSHQTTSKDGASLPPVKLRFDLGVCPSSLRRISCSRPNIERNAMSLCHASTGRWPLRGGIASKGRTEIGRPSRKASHSERALLAAASDAKVTFPKPQTRKTVTYARGIEGPSCPRLVGH